MEDNEIESRREAKEMTPVLDKTIMKPLSMKDKLKIFLLCLSQLTVKLSFSVLLIFYPVVAHNKGINPIQLGYVVSVYNFGSLFSAPFITYLISRKGTDIVLNGSLVLEALTAICFIFTNNIEDISNYLAVCIVIRVLQGISLMGVQTVTFTIITNEFPERVASLISLLETSSAIAFSVSSFCGGVLFEYLGFKAPFIALISLSTTSLILNCIFSSGKSAHKESKKPWIQSLRLLKYPSIYAGIIPIFLMILLQSYMASNASVFYMKSYNIDEVQIGILFGTNAIIYLTASIPIGLLVDYTGKTRQFLVVGILIRGIGYLFLAPETILRLKPSFAFGILGQGTISIAYIMCMVTIFKYLISIISDYGIQMDFDTSAVLATFVNIAQTAGAIVGPLVGSLLQEKFNFSIACNAFAILIMISASLIVVEVLTIRCKNRYSLLKTNDYTGLN